MFRQSLKEILERTEGCVGASIMGTDGIAVETLWKKEATDANFDVAVAEFTTLVRSGIRTSRDMGLGSMNEFIINCGESSFIMRLFNEDYFLILILQPNGNLGRARYELRRAELMLEKEFVS